MSLRQPVSFSRQGIDPRPSEIKILGFHRMITYV